MPLSACRSCIGAPTEWHVVPVSITASRSTQLQRADISILCSGSCQLHAQFYLVIITMLQLSHCQGSGAPILLLNCTRRRRCYPKLPSYIYSFYWCRVDEINMDLDTVYVYRVSSVSSHYFLFTTQYLSNISGQRVYLSEITARLITGLIHADFFLLRLPAARHGLLCDMPPSITSLLSHDALVIALHSVASYVLHASFCLLYYRDILLFSLGTELVICFLLMLSWIYKILI